MVRTRRRAYGPKNEEQRDRKYGQRPQSRKRNTGTKKGKKDR